MKTKEKLFLIIDTSKELYLALSDGEKIIDEYRGELLKQSEKLLPKLDKILKKNGARLGRKAKLADIEGIFVNVGPGSYTGLRVGIATANALGFSLNIPLVGIKEQEIKNNNLAGVGFKKFQKGKVEDQLLPVYFSKPKITKPKKK